MIEGLSRRLTEDFGRGFTFRNLESFRIFYLDYPNLVPIPHALRAELNAGTISAAQRRKLQITPKSEDQQILRAVSGESGREIPHALRTKSGIISRNMAGRIHHAVRVESSVAVTQPEIGDALRSQSWQPGQLHPNLSWTHYRTLLRVDKSAARAFYEIEATKNNWSARELERQINSLLYERLAMSRDKSGLMKLATKGHEIQKPADVFKDPVVIEFLGLPESPAMVESALEEALIGNLQAFLLEMGKGFAFVARQQRLTLDLKPVCFFEKT